MLAFELGDYFVLSAFETLDVYVVQDFVQHLYFIIQLKVGGLLYPNKIYS